jgi:cytochrome P450
VYKSLRERSPVHECPDGSIFLTRYRDINEVYRNARLFSSDKRAQFRPLLGDGLLYEHHTHSLVFNDPPLHTQVRKAFGNALSPKSVRAMAPAIESLVDDLLDKMAVQGESDIIRDFAGAIPVEVIGNMLTVPIEERDPLRRWSLAILGALEVQLSPEQLAHGNACVAEFLDYLKLLVERRRREMRDSDDDMLTRLLRWEDQGFKLSEKELYHQCIFLLNAGHETTTNLIGNGVQALLQHPEQLERLQNDAGLIDACVEEILRYESPNQLGNRTCTEDVEVGGVKVKAGTHLTLCIGAANRDPELFENPEVFDIGREHNPHLAFGAGIHTCAGLTVARLEGRIALSRLFQRFPQISLAAAPERAFRARFRGFEQLRCRLN